MMRWRKWPIAVLALATAACGSEVPVDASSGGEPMGAQAGVETEPTGAVIEVRMITDDRGNYFEPSEITAERGDVIRYVLDSGVHNASFPTEQNPGGAGLPAMGPMLQLPGQTYDVTVDVAPGQYYFQCDPHAALGMTGTLTVTD